MIEQTLAIIRNTFFESIRQPIVLVLLVIATLALLITSLTSTFTMADDQKMLVDIGLATVFMFGALLAAFIATSVLTREIENKTVLTVVSKPVGRPLFVIGKFLGVALAIIVASLYMSFVFCLIEHHGAIQTVRDPIHLPVVIFGITAGLVAIIVSVWCNYFYGKVFSSMMICTATPLAGLAYFFSLLFEPDFSRADFVQAFDTNIWSALLALILANIVLTALAIAFSTRLSQIMTIVFTVATFLLGMLSDWMFGGLMINKNETIWLNRAKTADNIEVIEVTQQVVKTSGETFETVKEVEQIISGSLTQYAEFNEWTVWATGKVLHSVVPNFQVLWLSDAVTQEHVIPGSYLVSVLFYGITCIVAALAFAVILFQRREVG